MPFNLIGIGLAFGIRYAWRLDNRPPIAGGAKLIETKEGKLIRLPGYPPLLAAGIVLVIVCSVSTIAISSTCGKYAPFTVTGSAWVIALSAGLWAYLWRKLRNTSGRNDLLLHADGQRVTLPQTRGRKISLTINRADIETLVIHVEFDSYKRPSRFIPTLVMLSGERLELAEWPAEILANRFTDWLRGELQLPPPMLGAKAS